MAGNATNKQAEKEEITHDLKKENMSLFSCQKNLSENFMKDSAMTRFGQFSITFRSMQSSTEQL